MRPRRIGGRVCSAARHPGPERAPAIPELRCMGGAGAAGDQAASGAAQCTRLTQPSEARHDVASDKKQISTRQQFT